MTTRNHYHLDEACERARKEFQQVLVKRKNAYARKKVGSKDSKTSEGLEDSTNKKFTNSSTSLLELQQCWKKKIRTAIIDCAKAENSAIIARIRDLPRELRDKIYLHLWEPEGSKDPTRDLLYWWEDSDKEWMIGGVDLSKSHSLANTTDLRWPHFVDLTFVDRKFVTEVLEQFKDTIGKDLRFFGNKAPVAEFLLDHESIGAFVNDDVLGVGKTIEELVRNLDLRIDFQCDDIEHVHIPYENEDSERLYYNNKSLSEDDESTSTKSPETDREEYLNVLNESIKLLLSIPYTERMVIHNGVSRCFDIRPRIVTLVIRHGSANIEENLVPILRLICRAYNSLRDKGFTTKVQFDSELGLKVLFEEKTWSWTEEEWRKNLEERNTSRIEAQDRDAQQMATIWGHLKTVFFKAAHTEP